MDGKLYLIIRRVTAIFIMLTCGVTVLNAQFLTKQTSPLSTYYDNNGNLGIGTTNPLARLEICSDSGFTAHSLFNAEIWNLSGKLASIQTLISNGNQKYGIYQTNALSQSIINYFQSPVKSGNATFGKWSSNTAAIFLDQNVSSLDVKFDPGQPPIDPVTPLSVDISGIRVRTNLVTDNFKMLTGAGAGKVLISDANGNASWINPPNGVISPWLVEDENIVTDPDYKNVGIGTEQPKKKLDIHHTDTPGGISLTQMLQDNANGSELSFNKNSNEGIAPQCSMGHGYFEGRSSFFIWSCLDKKGEGKTEFYIDLNNGMTGIGTEWPDATLEVAGDMKVKDKLGIGCTPPSDEIYKVFVEGGIEARKIRVTAKDYPDFCFNEEYPLMPLRDLKKFISLNKHLPGVPTAREVEDNKGIEIGEMQTILLKKVEEQTLYILDLQKQIEELKAQVGSLTEK